MKAWCRIIGLIGFLCATPILGQCYMWMYCVDLCESCYYTCETIGCMVGGYPVPCDPNYCSDEYNACVRSCDDSFECGPGGGFTAPGLEVASELGIA